MLIERRLGLQVRKKRVHTGVHMSQVRRTSPVGYKYTAMTVRAMLASCWLLSASIEAALPECPPGTPPTAGKCADHCNLAGYYTRGDCEADSRCTWCYALSQYSAYAKCYNKENANLAQVCDGSLPGCTCDTFGGSAQEAEGSEGQRRLSESRAEGGGGGGDDDEAKAARKKRKLERMAEMAKEGGGGGSEGVAETGADGGGGGADDEAKAARTQRQLERMAKMAPEGGGGGFAETGVEAAGGGHDDEAKAARKKRKMERMAKMAEGGDDGGIEDEARERRRKLDTPEAKEARRKIKLAAMKRELRRLAETEDPE